MPLEYTECNGYFADPGCTISVERGELIPKLNSSTQSVVQSSSSEYEEYNLYTYKATHKGDVISLRGVGYAYMTYNGDKYAKFWDDGDILSGQVVIPKYVENNGKLFEVREIGEFDETVNNFSLILPSGVKEVSERAFNDAPLTAINITDKVESFSKQS